MQKLKAVLVWLSLIISLSFFFLNTKPRQPEERGAHTYQTPVYVRVHVISVRLTETAQLSRSVTAHFQRICLVVFSPSRVTIFNCFRTNRAVRCVLERGDDMLITGGRLPVLGKYKV